MAKHFQKIQIHWQAIKMAAQFVAPYKRQVIYSLLALFFTAAITLSIGQGIRLLIDQGFATQSKDLLSQYVVIFLLLVIALAAGTFTRYYWVTWLGERVIADIRRKVFNHLIHLHPGFFEENRSLEIQSRLTADMTLLQAVIGSSISFALRNFIMMLGGIIWLFITNAKLTALVMVCVPLVVIPILVYGRRVRHLSRQSQDKVATVGAYVGEVLGQIKTVQAYKAPSHLQLAGFVLYCGDYIVDRTRYPLADRPGICDPVKGSVEPICRDIFIAGNRPGCRHLYPLLLGHLAGRASDCGYPTQGVQSSDPSASRIF